MPIYNTTKAYRECVAVKAVQAKHRTSLSTSRDNQTNMSKVLDLFTIFKQILLQLLYCTN